MINKNRQDFKEKIKVGAFTVGMIGALAATVGTVIEYGKQEYQKIQNRQRVVESKEIDARWFIKRIKEYSDNDNELSEEWYLNCEKLIDNVSRYDNFKLITELIEDNESSMYYESKKLFELLEKLDRYHNIDENIDDALTYDNRGTIKLKMLDIIKKRMCIIHK